MEKIPDDVGSWINKAVFAIQKQPHYLHAPHFIPDEAHPHRHSATLCVFLKVRVSVVCRIYGYGFQNNSGL